jgi:hypothetical protein
MQRSGNFLIRQRIITMAGASLLAIVLLVSVLPLKASAASSNITTSPISQDLPATPGTTVSTTLQVENNGQQAVPISVELKTFKASGTSGQAEITNPVANDPSLSWVHFSETSFTAEPGVWKTIQMSVSLPKDANLGYYYAVLFKPVLPTGPQAASTNTVNLSNAILVLVDTNSGNEVRQLQVSSLTSLHKLYQYLPASFNIVVHNTGNIYVPPDGELYISKDASFNHVLATLPINKSSGRVLPNSSRLFTIRWSDGFPVYQPETIDGQPVIKKGNKPVLKLHYNFSQANRFRFGKYYARMVLVYNNGQRDVPIYGVVSFWVIPWKLLLAILLIILLQIAIVITAIRYRQMYRVTNKKVSGETVKVKVKAPPTETK